MSDIFCFRLKNLLFTLLCLSCLIFTLNYELVSGFRPVDIIIILMLALSFFINPKFNKSILFLISVSISILCLSIFYGLMTKNIMGFERFGFIYKYIMILFIPILIINLDLPIEKIKTLYKFLLISFLLLSAWVIIYLYLLSTGMIKGAFRVSFPFSNYNISDAHLYSSYLSFFIVAYTLHLKKFLRHNFVIYSSIILFSLTCLALTGSRTGIVIILSAIVIKSIFLIFNIKKAIAFLFFIVVVIMLMPIINNFAISVFHFEAFEEYVKLFNRAILFSGGLDTSSLERVSNFREALDEVSDSAYLIGIGPLSSDYLWYDGIVSMIFTHGGFLLLVSVIMTIIVINFYAYKNSQKTGKNKEFFAFALLCFLYFLSNIITEYVMITRNALPILVFLSLLYVEIKMPHPEQNCIKARRQ